MRLLQYSIWGLKGLNSHNGHREWFSNNWFLVKSKLNDIFCNRKCKNSSTIKSRKDNIAQCDKYCLCDNIAKEKMHAIFEIADTCLAIFTIYCNIVQPYYIWYFAITRHLAVYSGWAALVFGLYQWRVQFYDVFNFYSASQSCKANRLMPLYVY